MSMTLACFLHGIQYNTVYAFTIDDNDNMTQYAFHCNMGTITSTVQSQIFPYIYIKQGTKKTRLPLKLERNKQIGQPKTC